MRICMVIRSNGTSVIKEIRLKNLTIVSRLSRSLKVIGTDAYRSPTYDFSIFSLAIMGLMPYRFRDKRWFQSKIAIFSTSRPVILRPAEGVLLGIGCHRSGAWGQKKQEWWAWAIGPRKKFDDIFSSLDTIYERDWRTDRQTSGSGDSKDRTTARLRIASRGQSCHFYLYLHPKFRTCGDMQLLI